MFLSKTGGFSCSIFLRYNWSIRFFRCFRLDYINRCELFKSCKSVNLECDGPSGCCRAIVVRIADRFSEPRLYDDYKFNSHCLKGGGIKPGAERRATESRDPDRVAPSNRCLTGGQVRGCNCLD